MASAPATDIFLRPVSQLSRRYPGLSAEGNTDRPWCDLTHVHSRVPCSAFLIRPTQLDCSAYVVICACICCCWCAYSPCPDLASTVVAVWRAAPLLPSVTRVVRSSVRLTCAFSRSSSRGPLSSPPAVAAAAYLLAAVAAADDDVLPSVLMEVPLLMSSLQPSHLLELGEDDEARRTSGS